MSASLYKYHINHTCLIQQKRKMATQKQVEKWEGKASVDLIVATAEQIWPFLEDFFGLDKWFPTLTTCLPAGGISGQPGCVRFCAGFKTPVNSGEEVMNWTKQKLLSIDPKGLEFCYSIVDGNVGFVSYVSWVKVVAGEGCRGCRIEWRYEVEPVEGWTAGDLDSFIGSGLEVMARRMEEAVRVLKLCSVYPDAEDATTATTVVGDARVKM